MAVGQTLENGSKTLENRKTLDDEILQLDENPVIKSDELQNPSRNFDDSEGILSGPVSVIKTLDEEILPLLENPGIISVELENPSGNFGECEGILSGSVSEIKTLSEDNLKLSEKLDIKSDELENPKRNFDENEGILSGPASEIKTLSEENLKLDEKSDIKSVEIENPSRNSDECCGSLCGVISEIGDLDEDLLKGSVVFHDSLVNYRKSSDVIVAKVTKTLGFEGIVGSIEFETSVLSSGKVDEVMGECSEVGLVSECCETGGVSGVVCDAQDAKVVDEINETMQVENTVNDDDDALVVKSLDEIPETMLLENSVSDCCEKDGSIGESFVIDDGHVAKTLEETTQYVKTVNEDGVPEIRNVQVGKTLEVCKTDGGEKVDDVKLDGASSSDDLDDGDDSDKERFSADELSGEPMSHGAYGNAYSNFGGIGWPFGQYPQKKCHCGRCSDGEDNEEGKLSIMGYPPNPYSHPYCSDPRMFPRYMDRDGFRGDPSMPPYPGYRDHNRRRRKGISSMAEREHWYRMDTDSRYRNYHMYHGNMGRFMRPDWMEEDTEDDHFHDCRYMNNRRGMMDRESRSNSNSSWRYHEPEPEPEPCPVGAGLFNLGNTCFLNSVMQCVTHIVPFVEGLQSLKHDASSHGEDEFCALCDVRQQIERSLIYSGKRISPSNLVDNLKYISSDFRRYQQEDAHDFLMSLFDKLDSSWSKHEANIEELSSSPDSLVKLLFGGRLVSQLHCCECGHNSDTYEPMIDLSLEIEDVDSLESALKSFTKVEDIQDTEKVRCNGCEETVLAQKQLTLDQAPQVAALHLKRFKSDGYRIEKIDRKIEYPLELDLNPYTKGAVENNEALKYELCGFVVHVGYTPTSGHYFCYIRTSPDTWYRFDDSKVTKVSESTALDQDAYILFYARKGTPWFGDLLDTWKANLEEKSKPSLNSVLNSTNLPSSSLNLGEAPHGCQDSDKIDTDSITYAQPLSILRPDDVDKESTAPGNISEPIYDGVLANKAEVNVQVEVTASEITQSETCPIVSDVLSTSVYDNVVHINPFISLESVDDNLVDVNPFVSLELVDDNAVDVNPSVSLEPVDDNVVDVNPSVSLEPVDDNVVDVNPFVSLELGTPDICSDKEGKNDVDINPCVSLKSGNSDMCSDKEEHAAEEVKEKMSLSMTKSLRRTAQVSPRKEAAKYAKLSPLPGGRCKTSMSTACQEKRLKMSLLHRHCPS